MSLSSTSLRISTCISGIGVKKKLQFFRTPACPVKPLSGWRGCSLRKSGAKHGTIASRSWRFAACIIRSNTNLGDECFCASCTCSTDMGYPLFFVTYVADLLNWCVFPVPDKSIDDHAFFHHEEEAHLPHTFLNFR